MRYPDHNAPRIPGIGPAAARIMIQLSEGASTVMGLTDETHSSALNNCVKAKLVTMEVKAMGAPAIYSITEAGINYLDGLHPR